MKIGCVGPAPPFRGGIAHFGVRLAQELSREHVVHYLNFSRLYPSTLFPGKTQLDDSAHAIDFPTHHILDSVNPLTWRKAARYIADAECDVVLYHWWHGFFAPCYRAVRAWSGKRPLEIAICHNVLPHDSNKLWESAVRIGLGGMDGYVVHSSTEGKKLASLFGAAPYTELFHPLYDVFPGEEVSRTEARKALGLEEKDHVLLFFGLIRPYKGVQVLLDALRLLEDVPHLRCLIVGEIYAGKEEIEAKLKGISSDRIKLVDKYVPNEEVTRWFRAADIVTLPYLATSQSGIIPIAYRCERPVIATRVGGIPDVVEEGVTGYLVEPDSPKALAHTIREHFVERGAPSFAEGIRSMCERLSWGEYAQGLTHFIEEKQRER